MNVRQRLAEIEQQSPAAVRQRTAQLLSTAPNGKWPCGMPCPLWPELVIVGISPGNSPARTPTALPKPMLGPTAHEHFSYEDTAGYWRKIRQLAHAFFCNLDGHATEEDSVKLTAHLNSGTRAAGKASEENIEPKYVRWIASLLDGALQPKAVILLGYVGFARKRNSVFRDAWTSGNALNVDWGTPERKVSIAGSRYSFRSWRCMNSTGRALDIILWPNHPSRLRGNAWSSSLQAFSQLGISG